MPKGCSRRCHHDPEVGNSKTGILQKLKMLVKNILIVVIKSNHEGTSERYSIGLDLPDVLGKISVVVLKLVSLLQAFRVRGLY